MKVQTRLEPIDADPAVKAAALRVSQTQLDLIDVKAELDRLFSAARAATAGDELATAAESYLAGGSIDTDAGDTSERIEACERRRVVIERAIALARRQLDTERQRAARAVVDSVAAERYRVLARELIQATVKLSAAADALRNYRGELEAAGISPGSFSEFEVPSGSLLSWAPGMEERSTSKIGWLCAWGRKIGALSERESRAIMGDGVHLVAA